VFQFNRPPACPTGVRSGNAAKRPYFAGLADLYGKLAPSSVTLSTHLPLRRLIGKDHQSRNQISNSRSRSVFVSTVMCQRAGPLSDASW